MRAAKIESFDLKTRSGRYLARQNGFDIPKKRHGRRAKSFDEQIDKSQDCWIWTSSVNKDGYGKYTVGGKTFRAHKFAWERASGPVPDGKVLMHFCDQPRCCKPAHMSVATHAENMTDKVNKGRQAKGECVGSAKLSDEIVLRIRAEYVFRKVTYKDLSIRYGVSKDCIQKAVRSINWKHL